MAMTMDDHAKYRERTVIVTGASKGIGRAIAKSCVGLGANVVAVYKSDDRAACDLKRESVGNLQIIKADISKESEVRRVINETVDAFGSIDVLVNNAGIGNLTSIMDCTLEEWNEILSVNLTSIFLFTKHAAQFLEKSSDGLIINVSSRRGLFENNAYGTAAYAASKAAVIRFTLDASRELACCGIRVNAIIPTVTKNSSLFDRIVTKQEKKQFEREGKVGTLGEAVDLVMELIDDSSANGKILVDRRVAFNSKAWVFARSKCFETTGSIG